MLPLSGFEEIPHTADWALRVWAPDLPELLRAAAEGMYRLMEVRLRPRPRTRRTLSLSAADPESLLVSFLGELLFIAEQESLAFDRIHLSLDGLDLRANLSGAPIASQSKLIKAVTYHKLAILATPTGLETTIVFDV